MESLKEIKFNHKEQNIPLAMGLSDDEVVLISNRVREINAETRTITGTLEKLIEEFQGAQLLFAILDTGVSLGEQQKSPTDLLSKLIGGGTDDCDCPACRARRCCQFYRKV